ncbi:Retrovirus-related Pol poly from transposon opus [Labeo rohita]|uniref:Retrovirus-related Pol poly from transposon opus n=1 Tax=Labeo rohita TaxID=84645 RepID=A0A498N0C3_LABRO|nr:Retrovirus-related Pol poly from transposon opus [Labeo rohita]
MDRFQVPPPQNFDFSKPEEWPKWSKRFERFRVASGLELQPEENQVNTLIYTMGDKAEDILTSLRLTSEQLMDTGADVTVVSEELFNEENFGKLQKTSKKLLGPGQDSLQVKGKSTATADVLSRAPGEGGGDTDKQQNEEELSLYVNLVVTSLPATEKRLHEIQQHQEADPILQLVKKYSLEGWHTKSRVEAMVQPYFQFAGELTDRRKQSDIKRQKIFRRYKGHHKTFQSEKSKH